MTRLAEAVDSRDPSVGLAAVAALRTLVDELENLHVENARTCGWSCRPSLTPSASPDSQPTRKHHADGLRGPVGIGGGEPSMFERLDPSATKVLEAAFSEATQPGR